MAIAINVVTSVINLTSATLNAVGTLAKTAYDHKVTTTALSAAVFIYCRPDLAKSGIDYVVNNKDLLKGSVDKYVRTAESYGGWIASSGAARCQNAFMAAKDYLAPPARAWYQVW